MLSLKLPGYIILIEKIVKIVRVWVLVALSRGCVHELGKSQWNTGFMVLLKALPCV